MTTQADCSIGIKVEAVYGTAVVVDQFPEFLTESLDRKPTFLQGKGLRVASRVDRADRRSLGEELAEGSITIEAPIKGLGIFLNAAMGAVTSTVVAGQTPPVYQQVHTPALTDPINSYTIQKGIPPLGGGATTPITFPGSVCKSMEISAKQGAIVEVTTDWTAREVQTAPTYAAPSYPTPLDAFTFVHGAICIGGTVVGPTTTAIASGGLSVADITDFSLKWDQGLDAKGWNLGGAGKRTRKPAVGPAKLTGKITAEYDTVALRDAYLAQTDLALLLTFTHPAIIGTSAHPVLQIWVPLINLNGNIPASNGGKVITQSIDFDGLSNLINPPFTVVYVTTDTVV
jgi:hypothetical protein